MRDPFISPPAALVALVQPVATSLSLPALAPHLHEVFIGWAVYHVLDRYVSPALSRLLFPRTYGSIDARTRINWDMRVAALTQAVCVSALAVWIKYVDQEVAAMDGKQRLYGYSGGIGMVQGFAAGYFLWDLSVCLTHYRLLGPETLVHATSALVMILLAFRPFMQYYGLNFIMYEISTPFLNIHWFLDKFNMTGTKIQLYNGLLLVSTFVLSRLVWGSFNIIRMTYDVWTTARSAGIDLDSTYATNGSSDGFLSGKENSGDPRPFETWLAGVFIGGNIVLWSLNVFWLGQMIKALRKRFTPTQQTKKAN
ncbi:hypothetical protein BP5796_05711 [Coleophoma crateriformis]|uniref:TLC domain-containing protein n=1 Tax=Coleophoma crateriformis TaxID=565419 RepID=A0A3D8RUV8_9HELO|nr:hypothetical protein BP5796_05711 [Coleophoma crateriformis]